MGSSWVAERQLASQGLGFVELCWKVTKVCVPAVMNNIKSNPSANRFYVSNFLNVHLNFFCRCRMHFIFLSRVWFKLYIPLLIFNIIYLNCIFYRVIYGLHSFISKCHAQSFRLCLKVFLLFLCELLLLFSQRCLFYFILFLVFSVFCSFLYTYNFCKPLVFLSWYTLLISLFRIFNLSSPSVLPDD